MALRLWKQWFYRLGGVDDFESPPRCFEDQLLALKLKLCSGNKSHLHVRKEDWVVGSIHLHELFLPVLAIWMIWPATRMGICLLSTCLSGLGSSWLDGRSFGAGHRWTVAIVGWEQRVLGGILVCMVYVSFLWCGHMNERCRIWKLKMDWKSLLHLKYWEDFHDFHGFFSRFPGFLTSRVIFYGSMRSRSVPPLPRTCVTCCQHPWEILEMATQRLLSLNTKWWQNDMHL